MIVNLKITKEQKNALLSFYPRGIKQFIQKTISDTADRIIIETDQFNIEEELKEYHKQRVLNNYNIHSRKHTQATKDKISKTLKEKYEGKEKFTPLPETRQRMSENHKGMEGLKHSEESKRKMREKHTGMKYKKRIKKVECIT